MGGAIAVVPDASGRGYWLVTGTGHVYAFGDAPDDGGMAGRHLNGPIIAGSGY